MSACKIRILRGDGEILGKRLKLTRTPIPHVFGTRFPHVPPLSAIVASTRTLRIAPSVRPVPVYNAGRIVTDGLLYFAVLKRVKRMSDTAASFSDDAPRKRPRLASGVVVIMLSGRPCVGKSTFCARFHETMRVLGHVTVNVIAADAVAYAVCDKHNASLASAATDDKAPLDAAGASAATEDGGGKATGVDKSSSAPGLFKQNSGTDVDPATLPPGFLTYADVWNVRREDVDALFEETFESALHGPRPSVVVLDYVFLREDERAAALQKAQQAGVSADDCVCVSFEVGDERNYALKLTERNAARANKRIGIDIIESLLKEASLPSEAEGFGLILRCPAILEDGWDAAQTAACDTVIATVKRTCQF